MHIPGIPGIPVAGQVSMATSRGVVNDNRALITMKLQCCMMANLTRRDEETRKDERRQGDEEEEKIEMSGERIGEIR